MMINYRRPITLSQPSLLIRAPHHHRLINVRIADIFYKQNHQFYHQTIKSAPLNIITCKSDKGGGSGVLDQPITKPDISKKDQVLRKRPPIYRVLLHNDNHNRREYVVQVLLKIVNNLTLDDAVNIMQEAHLNGIALVTACAQEDAEKYCQGLRNNGLTCTIEPDTGPCSND